jgi:HPr kinase/phosphorylase
MSANGATMHASAVLVGRRAAVIRGPAGAGKSRLALALIRAAEVHLLPFARLVGDDRIHAQASHGNLLVRPSASLAGLIEVRGLGIRRLPYEPVAAVGLIVDLVAAAERLPPAAARQAAILGILLPRLTISVEADALAMILALVRTVGLEA